MGAGRLRCETGQHDEVGVVVDHRAQRLGGTASSAYAPFFISATTRRPTRSPLASRPGLDDRACDCDPAHLRQLHTADAGFGLVVHTEALADVREVDTDRGGLE